VRVMTEADVITRKGDRVKEEAEDLPLVKTGIEGLDEIIGGFIRGRTYLVAGETGTGKTLFSLSFLVYGAMNGEPGVYLLVDEDYDDLIRGARAFGWDLEYLVKNDLLSVLTLLPDFPERVRKKSVDTIVNSIVSSIEEEVARLNAQRLVIDPVAPLVVGETDLVRVREYIRNLVITIEKELGTTTIITSEVPTGSNQLSRFGVEEFLAAGVIVLGLQRVGNKFYRTMFIRKMRWRPVQPAIYYFDIVPGRGIVVKGPAK